jgi:hypothetical protein
MKRNQKENYKRTTPFRRSLRYQSIFIGLCYSCNNFGNKAKIAKLMLKTETTMKVTLELIISESLMMCLTKTITVLAH